MDGEKVSDLIDDLDRNSYSFIYYSKPFDDSEYLASGKLFEIGKTNQKLSELDKIILNFRDNVSAGDLVESIPIFFGYVKFPSTTKEKIWSNFNEVSWFIPQFVIFSRENKLYCVQNFLSSSLQDDLNSKHTVEVQNFIQQLVRKSVTEKASAKIEKISDDDFSNWEKKVVGAVNEIKENKLQKIVLARKVEYKISGKVLWNDIFEKLNSEYPDCMNFLIKSHQDYFFGSSPELLGKFEKDIFRTEALAGSINRGSDEYEDSDLALLLSASKKNKKEHDIVIDHLHDNLQKHLLNIDIDETPLIKRLKNIQHLQTKISGRLKESPKYFQLIDSVFPTPAICGIPTKQSLNELKTLEGFDRGLYSGIVGSFNLSGEAEFFVAIRSALISENKLIAFAGCGIVEESNPDEEFNETELKLQPIISLFNNEDKS
ncbi:Menaquinone-specific isochorismate synthase [Ignavibacterium album JCM 16511]|uniref:isochorismate synthase n=1 Tax=Ignavibacterium album (strain DSM 19864 / JCM 16511 / NBRC 101810 / Mat9-16) TaxID=945713 RepID=I0AJ74_IGNAJ|nr:Menaquinone-specific isochorismate synthase [Ignavibacterium album JCM 16511]